MSKSAFPLIAVILLLAISVMVSAEPTVPTAPVVLPEIPDAELSPDYKAGGMVLGEMLESIEKKDAGARDTVRLKARLILGGGMQPGEVLVRLPRQSGVAKKEPGPVIAAELKAGTEVLAVLHEEQATGRIYSAQVLVPFDTVDKAYYNTHGQIGTWLRIQDQDKKRLRYALSDMDFNNLSPRVQLFALKKLNEDAMPDLAIRKVIALFLDPQRDEEIRAMAYALIHKWMPEVHGDSGMMAVNALIKGLRDPSLRIRVRALQLLPATAAHEDVEQGEFFFYPQIITAIGEAAKTEQNPGVRKLAQDALAQIRTVVRKMKQSLGVAKDGAGEAVQTGK